MSQILVFDSGMGCLPIAQSIIKHCPNAQLTLIADKAFYPYGDKSDEALIFRINEVIKQATLNFSPDLVVLACNTASTIALQSTRALLSIPVVGVVPAIKPAAEQSHSKHIGLIATPATIKRSYTRQLINDFAAHCEVMLLGSTELVQMSEDFILTRTINIESLKSILKPLIVASEESSLDQLVLGCTHFPLLKSAIQTLLPKVSVIDSSDAIGRQVARIVMPLTSGHSSKVRLYLTQQEGGNVINFSASELPDKAMFENLD